MRSLWILAVITVLAGLSACAEKPQTTERRSVGTAANAGTGGGPYTQPGWKAGDATSWEEHMRVRTQNGQNEYVRSGGK